MLRHFTNIKWSLFALDTLCYWASVITIGRPKMFSFTIPGLVTYCLIYIVLMLGLYAFKAYGQEVLSNGKKECAVRILMAILVSAIFAAGIVTMFFSIYNLSPIRFLKSLGVCAAIMPLLRLLAQIYIKRMLPSRRCIVIGDKVKWHSIMLQISDAMSRKLLPVAYCNGDLGDLARCLSNKSNSISIVVAEEKHVRNTLLMDRLNKTGLDIYYMPHIAERSLKRIPMEVLESFSSYYTLCFQAIGPRAVERSFNLAAAGTLTILSAPISLLAAFVIWATDGFSILFRQARTGIRGRPFVIYKFRTMSNAPASCHGDPDKDCQRLTRAGKIIRKLRIDEIPQFINVIIGNMNLVGPRPEIDKFIDMCSGTVPFYEYRHRIKPGITGWAQVNYRYTSDIEAYRHKTEYDLYYVKNQSILLDIAIIISTIGTMIGMKGAK